MGPSDWKVDGFSGRVVGGSYSPNLFGYEQVVALKGPAGILYGASGQPGGQVSLVTKKPRDVASVSVTSRLRTYAGGEVGFGDDTGLEFELDATGPVDRDGRVLYRALAAVAHALERPAFSDDNQFYRAAFTFRPDRARRLAVTPSLEWSREDRAERHSAISPSTSRTVSDGRTDYTLADATPRDRALTAGGRVDDNLTAGLDVAANLNDAWHASAAVRYHDRTFRRDAWLLQTATLRQADLNDPRSWEISRRHTRAGNDYEDLSFDVNTDYSARLGEHVLNFTQVGLNLRTNETLASVAQNGANQSPINLYTGVAAAPLVADAAAPPRGNLTRTTAWNFYVQNRTTIAERLVVSISGGHVGERTETISPSGGSEGATNRDSGVTPNLGLVYLLSDKASLYASYATSYTLPDAAYEDEHGNIGRFDPTEGDSMEFGAKAELWGDLLAASAAVFQTELNDTLIVSDAGDLNPNGNRYYRQVDGGRASRGVELEFTIEPVRHWATTFTYAYIDAFDRNRDGTRAGRAPMTPRHAGTVFSRYTFTRDGWLQGWTAQLGLLWQGERIGGQAAISPTNPDPLRLGSFYRLDVGISRHWRHWQFALNLENVTNADYLLGGSTGLNLERANPRALTLRVGHTW